MILKDHKSGKNSPSLDDDDFYANLGLIGFTLSRGMHVFMWLGVLLSQVLTKLNYPEQSTI